MRTDREAGSEACRHLGRHRPPYLVPHLGMKGKSARRRLWYIYLTVKYKGELTQSDKSHSRALERRKRSWLEIESGGALVQSRVNTYLILSYLLSYSESEIADTGDGGSVKTEV